MEFALVPPNIRSTAIRGVSAICPQCYEPVRPRCGTINVHHWAHLQRNCDPWSEPETRWHRYWKHLFPASRTEVVRGAHRADILRGDGRVVELQHSTISVTDIRAREAAYGSMIWLFDGRSIPSDRLNFRQRDGYVSFRWKHPRKHYAACRCPVFIDFGRRVFRLRKLYLDEPPYGGWGTFGTHAAFVSWLTR